MEKCTSCKKKSHVLVTCSCNHKYCMTCRLPEVHQCNFNFKEQGKTKLIKDNPVVVAEKLLKI